MAAGQSPLAVLQGGSALSSGVGSVFSNPAGAAGMNVRSAQAIFNIAGISEGIEQSFAYAEPDNGLLSGAIAWTKERHATGYDGVAGEWLYDRTTSWIYVVASELNPQTSVGGRVRYEQVQSDERGESGTGYRLDVGVTRVLGAGFAAALRVDGIFGTGINWAGGTRSPHERTLFLGGAWQGAGVNVSLDVVGTTIPGVWGVQGGASTHVGPVVVAAGASLFDGEMDWTLGGSYEIDQWLIEYAYQYETGGHLAGVTWRF